MCLAVRSHFLPVLWPLQFHNFKNSSTATCILTSSILVIYILEVTCFSNFPLWASPISSGLGASICAVPGLTRVVSFSPESGHPQHHWLRQHHPSSEQRPQELQRVRRLFKRKVHAVSCLKTEGGQDAATQTRSNSLLHGTCSSGVGCLWDPGLGLLSLGHRLMLLHGCVSWFTRPSVVGYGMLPKM